MNQTQDDTPKTNNQKSHFHHHRFTPTLKGAGNGENSIRSIKQTKYLEDPEKYIRTHFNRWEKN